VAQADFGRNLKPAPVAKLSVFSDFSFALAFRKVLFVFSHIKSTPCGAKSTTVVAYQSPLRTATKVDFGFQVASQSPFRAATKVDFGFQVASQSPLCAAQSRLRFSSRILKFGLPASKVDFGRI
jgi:hypothetical protein